MRSNKMTAFRDIAKIIGDTVVFAYIYFSILAAVIVSLSVMIIKYITKKKTSDEKTDTQKKYVPSGISIIVVTAALLLLLAPIAVVSL